MRAIIIFLVTVAVTNVAVAQQYPSPEFQNQPYYYDPSSKQLLQLEKATAKMRSKTKMLGYGGSSTYYDVDGEKSSVTITAADTISFVVSSNFASMGMDITQMISLYKFNSVKGSRQAILAAQKGKFGGSNGSDKIDFNVKKYGNDLVFVVSKKLPSGDYGFVNMMEMQSGREVTVYCFHVD